MRIRLTPATGGEPKVFDVVGADFETTKNQLTLTCRDGRVCMGLQGSWEMSITKSRILPMSIDEVERIHDGRSIIATVN